MNNNFKSIKSVLKTVLNEARLEKAVQSELLFQNWKKIVGEKIAGLSRPLKIEDNILFLKVDNNIWRQELSLKQEEIIRLIENASIEQKIKKIIFV